MKRIFNISILIAMIIIIAGLVVLAKASGYFDPSVIRVDNINIERPQYYNYLGEDGGDITLSDENSLALISFSSLFYNDSVTYSIMKSEADSKFVAMSNKLLRDRKINIESCNVIYEKGEKIGDNASSGRITIIKKPYIVSFNEKSKQREKKAISEICGDNKTLTLTNSHVSAGAGVGVGAGVGR